MLKVGLAQADIYVGLKDLVGFRHTTPITKKRMEKKIEIEVESGIM